MNEFQVGRFLTGKGKEALTPEFHRQMKRLYKLICKDATTEEELACDRLSDVDASRKARDSETKATPLDARPLFRLKGASSRHGRKRT